MIMNEHLLNDKEKQIVILIRNYFESLNLGDFPIFVDHGEPHSIEFRHDLFRLIMYYKPEDDEVESQIQIPTICFDASIRHKGFFMGLMKVIIKFCLENNDIPILFLQVVSDNFANKLVKEYRGIIAQEDLFEGSFIFVLPKENLHLVN